MNIPNPPRSSWTRLLAFAAALLCSAAMAQAPQGASDSDPPVRVGRLSYLSGEVSFSPGGNDEWVHASVNRPIVTGDKLWADNQARAEIAVDNSTWWLGEQTSVVVSNLDDRVVQLQLQQGSLDVRVRRFAEGNIVEVDTPNLAFSITRPGRYRIEVDPQGDTTMVAVRAGMGDVYGESASYVVTSGQAYRFYGTDVSDSELVALPRQDAFDTWVASRDRRYDRVASVRYVSPEVVGYEDLDGYGGWSVVSDYGNVWFPRRVQAGWAPYRDGHWAWIDPWGWTWVDDQPWGFAPFHYGRWAYFNRGWGWIPGPRTVRPVYAPALVAFVGGAGFGLSVSSGPAIGWFALGPREVYVPPYSVSRNYFRQVNVSNTTVNVTNITNIYNNPAQVAQLNYVNRAAPNGVTAVPPAAFAQSQNVARAAVALPAGAIQRAEVRPVAAVAPARPAFLGAAPVAQARPPAAVVQRAVVAKAPPPPPPVPDLQKMQALEKNPGRPLNRAELQTLRRATPPSATAQPQVKVVEQPKPAATAAPPARAEGAAGSRRAGGPPGAAGAGIAPPSGTPSAAATAPPGAAPPGNSGARPGEGPARAGPLGRAPQAGAEGGRAPEAKGPPVARPPQAQRETGAPGRPGTPPGLERAAPAAPPAPGAAEGRQGAPERAGGPRGPAERAAEAPGPQGASPIARPPNAPGAGRPGVGRPEAAGPGQPLARPPEARPQVQERAAPQRPPEASAPGQPPRALQERASPQRPPEARPQPQERAAPQRPPEARPQPLPQRAPEARPQPLPQRAPEARPQPQERAAPQRPPEARPQPQPQRAPESRPEPPRPPQAQGGPPQAQGGPPPAQGQLGRPQRPDEKGKGKGKDEGQ
jgi:hypothetical protein